MPVKASGSATFSRNVAMSLLRVIVNSLVALVLPAYLTHHLPIATYGAWVLILQLSAYVSFLDFGVQTGVAKFVAEYEARGDNAGAGQRATAGLVIMGIAGTIGITLTLLLAWQVPRLFADMPAYLYGDVRTSVRLIGTSLSFGLFCSVFSAIFLGLQRYVVPMTILIVNRIAFTAAVLMAVIFHGSLATMGAAVALINIFTGLLQIGVWKKLANRIRINFSSIDSTMMKQMLEYCLVLAIWSAAMLCISGLDVTIVGHYDFKRTGYYSIATLPNNLMLMILSAALGPLLPATSALSTKRTPKELGQLLARTTRYTTILLLLTGLTLLVGGYPILKLWVGTEYAQHCLPLLRILVLANILRNLCLPYATMVIAVGRQRAATASAISEAVVNLGSSIYFASRLGALGVAYGTLLGAAVGIAMHFILSMRYTYGILAIGRKELLVKSLMRPGIICIPAALLYRSWWLPRLAIPNAPTLLACAIGTMLLAWFVGLKLEERQRIVRFLSHRSASFGTGAST
jgi:O-antigen/teichoic acid export membrane protein